jgi:hypothetical protein
MDLCYPSEMENWTLSQGWLKSADICIVFKHGIDSMQYLNGSEFLLHYALSPIEMLQETDMPAYTEQLSWSNSVLLFDGYNEMSCVV